MFGYLKPDKPYLYLKDDTLYNALYCGVCKSIKNTCGNTCRFTLTYDVAFLSALVHNICGVDVDIKRKNCVAHPIKKRPIAMPDGISKKLANVNVLLAYYKLRDDVVDENKGNFKSLLFKKGYKKAKKALPNIDGVINNGYQNLLKLEKQNSSSIDMVSDCFATMMAEISNEIFENYKSNYTYNLVYAVAKWVYLIDALDDYDKDIKKNCYNVFYNAYKSPNYAELIKANSQELAFVFNSIFSQIKENYENIPKKYNTDLVENVLFKGMPKTTVSILKKQGDK